MPVSVTPSLQRSVQGGAPVRATETGALCVWQTVPPPETTAVAGAVTGMLLVDEVEQPPFETVTESWSGDAAPPKRRSSASPRPR